MLVVKGVVFTKGVPPVAVVYHCILSPVTIKLAIVGLFAEQKFCSVSPSGSLGDGFMVITTLFVAVLPELVMLTW